MNRFTLRQLQIFAAVARTENVSHAARTLALSQSAVSGALADLESQFDVELFDRVGKRVQLNELGRALRPRAEALLEEAEAVERALDRSAGGGRLRVGATLTIGSYVAVPLLARFMADEPETSVTLEVANTREIARRVENFEIDVGLVEGELSHPELEISPWRQDELVIFAAPGHPLVRMARLVTDADLTAAPWILRESGSGTRQAFDRTMQGLLSGLRITLELQHTEAIKQAVAEGLGLGCLSRLAVEDDFRADRLAPLLVRHRDFRRHFFFVLHRKKYRSPALLRWLSVCRAGAPGETRPDPARHRRGAGGKRSGKETLPRRGAKQAPEERGIRRRVGRGGVGSE